MSPFLRVPDGIWRFWDKGQCQTHGEGMLGVMVTRTWVSRKVFNLVVTRMMNTHLPHRGPFPTTRTSTVQIQVDAHLYS